MKLRVLSILWLGVQELPEDFGKLQSLEDLNAIECSSLSRLLESFGQLTKLERLYLNRCYDLQSLPTSICGLTKLRVLDIWHLGVQELPEDFGKLQSLVDFNASGCSSLSRLSESFG
jgi:Leucine-rich repeat (LRR) protein